MSYSVSVPNVPRGVELVELQDRVMATCDATGLTETDVRNRVRESANYALDIIEKMELKGEAFNLSFSGHVKRSDEEVAPDYAALMVTAVSQVC